MTSTITRGCYLLIGVCIGVLIATVRCYQETPVRPQKTPSMTSSTTIEVTKKPTSSSPDLVVTQKYTADINGERVEVPLKNIKDDTTTKVTTEVDVTPLVNKLTPNWEAGVGVSYLNKEILPTISVQRNYQNDRAVEMCLYLKGNHVEGGTLMHKWLF